MCDAQGEVWPAEPSLVGSLTSTLAHARVMHLLLDETRAMDGDLVPRGQLCVTNAF